MMVSQHVHGIPRCASHPTVALRAWWAERIVLPTNVIVILCFVSEGGRGVLGRSSHVVRRGPAEAVRPPDVLIDRFSGAAGHTLKAMIAVVTPIINLFHFHVGLLVDSGGCGIQRPTLLRYSSYSAPKRARRVGSSYTSTSRWNPAAGTTAYSNRGGDRNSHASPNSTRSAPM